jgi:hypothetical protein
MTTMQLLCMLLHDFAPLTLLTFLLSSPQGRIFQVEYAQEAVKQGSVVVGIASKTHVVLAAIKVRLPGSITNVAWHVFHERLSTLLVTH